MGTYADSVNNFGDTRSGGLAGPMGLFVIVLLSIATVLLIRNMNKRLRRLPDTFPDAAQTQREAEIARLNADLAHPGTATAAPAAAGDRPEPLTSAEDGEVTGVNTDSDGGSTGGDPGRV